MNTSGEILGFDLRAPRIRSSPLSYKQALYYHRYVCQGDHRKPPWRLFGARTNFPFHLRAGPTFSHPPFSGREPSIPTTLLFICIYSNQAFPWPTRSSVFWTSLSNPLTTPPTSPREIYFFQYYYAKFLQNMYLGLQFLFYGWHLKEQSTYHCYTPSPNLSIYREVVASVL